MKIKVALAVLAFIWGVSFSGEGQELSPDAPKDKPNGVNAEQAAAMDRAIAPYVAKARATYPDAKKRYLAGLPPKNIFFVTVRLHDRNGIFEQAFIAVRGIENGKITGTIANDLQIVKDYRNGDKYVCSENDILDWTISKPDGTEEGNYVGKFLDTYKP